MKFDAEKIVIIAFFALMMWTGIGTLWSHTLSHDFPYGYSAADAYQHQVRAEWVKQQGNYATEAPYILAGYEGVIGYYMPGTSHLAAMLSYASGLQSYDALYLLVFIAAILSAIVMYYGVKHYNRHIALLSLPLTTLMFAKNFYMGILVGQWPFIIGTLFLLGTFWALSRIELPKSAILLIIFTSAVALSHTSEMIFVAGFVAVALTVAALKKDWKASKTIIASGIIAAAISAYYMIIFFFTWGKRFGYHFYVENVNQGFPNVRMLQDFQLWIIIIILAGMISIYYRNTLLSIGSAALAATAAKLLSIPSKITSDTAAVGIYALLAAAFIYVVWKRKPHIAEMLGPYMLIIGYASFVGFGPRAFQTRFMWPVTLAPLFGIGAYKLISLAKNSAKINWTTLHTTATAIIITAAIIGMNYQPLSTQGTMYNERWEMFKWLQGNLNIKDEVMFMYGDGYDQTSMLYNAHAINYLISPQDYIDGINKHAIKHEYEYSINLDYGTGLPFRKGLFGFTYKLEGNKSELPPYNKNICRYGYYVFDKTTSSQQLAPLIQYNNAIKQTFLQSGMTISFENAATSIVKNNNGGNCIGQT
ncbi:hypothetical protein HYU12_00425 [Candidatus Woesearchaeota archaeon]|nr:hypothetical protein [Candidatus Woesearchaeota archaeon]